MLRPDHSAITQARLASFLASSDPELQREGIRTLAQRTDAESLELLRKLAADGKKPGWQRMEAVAGLARSASAPATQNTLFSLLADQALARDPDERFEREVLRSLRGVAGKPDVARIVLAAAKDLLQVEKPTEEQRELAAQVVLSLRGQKEAAEWLKRIAAVAGPRPAKSADWLKALESKGDAAAGARLFFHPEGPKCFTCHKVDGRGGNAGPELSKIAASLNRDKLIDSILAPSKEVAPQFVAWVIGTKDGKVTTGIILHEDTNHYVLGDAQGKPVKIMKADIEEKQAAKTSLMPDNLHDLMTLQEFRDLLAYLTELK